MVARFALLSASDASRQALAHWVAVQVGNLTYGDAPRGAVSLDTMYDLASMTKIIATTTAVAVLYERGYLNLSSKIRDFLGTGADGAPLAAFPNVTVRNCLLHNAGFPPDPTPFNYWSVLISVCTPDHSVHTPQAYHGPLRRCARLGLLPSSGILGLGATVPPWLLFRLSTARSESTRRISSKSWLIRRGNSTSTATCP